MLYLSVMFVVCLLLLLDALLRLHPLPSHTPRGAGALTWFNSRRQLRVFPCLRAAQGAPGLRFSRQVHPFPGVNERALAQELQAALLRGLRGNLGRRLRLQEGVFQHRDLGHPPGRGRPGHPPLGRRPAEPRAQGGAGLGGAGDLRPQGRGRRPQAPRPPGVAEKEASAQVQLRPGTRVGRGAFLHLSEIPGDAKFGAHFPSCASLTGRPRPHLSPLLSSLSHNVCWAEGHFSHSKLPERSEKSPLFCPKEAWLQLSPSLGSSDTNDALAEQPWFCDPGRGGPESRALSLCSPEPGLLFLGLILGIGEGSSQRRGDRRHRVPLVSRLLCSWVYKGSESQTSPLSRIHSLPAVFWDLKHPWQVLIYYT